jgi:hypothetical protein
VAVEVEEGASPLDPLAFVMEMVRGMNADRMTCCLVVPSRLNIHVVAREMAHEMNAGRRRHSHEAQLLVRIPALAKETVRETRRAEKMRHCFSESSRAFGMEIVHGTKAEKMKHSLEA